MKDKLVKLKSDINKMIDKLGEDSILGPIGYLEECLENIDAAIEELDEYFKDEE